MSGKLTSERRIFLSTDIASRSEMRVAMATVLAFAALFFALVPFATMRLMQLAPVIPAYNAGLVISDVITAVLLLSRFSLLRSRALLMLASGYLFTAFITISYTLTYPALFSPTGLLGAGPESTAWLYMFWHAGFPLFVIAYGLLKNEKLSSETKGESDQLSLRWAGLALPAAVGLSLVVACGLTEVATVGHSWLPALIVNGQFTWRMTSIVSGIWILSLLSLFILWRERPHTVLDVWLVVVMSAWICDIALGTVFNASRYDLGFYAGRFYGTLAADFLLVVLLLENGKHYTRLVRAESMYRGLLEAAPDAMVVVDRNGEIVLLNSRAEDQFGYSRAELVGRKVENIIPEGFTERLRADGRRSAAEALAQQIGMGIELYGRRKNGLDFPMEIMLSPLESANGILVTAAIRDISVRKAAELHLVQMEARYRGLLEAAPDAMVVVNQLGKIVLLNVRAEEQFGYPRDELLGQLVTNIIPEGFAERILADGRRSASEALAQQIGMGIELCGLRKNGSDFPMEIMLSPLQGTEGILVTAAIRDISVRQAAERSLVQIEARYRGLLEAAPDAMVVVNRDDEIVLLNVRAEEEFGYSRDELLGQKVTNIIPEGFAERLLADGRRSAAEALAQQIGMGIELYGRRKNGSDFPIEIMLSPLKSTDGILVTAAIRDISARREAEAQLLLKVEELNRSNGELEQFAYVASHDLQEPLRMVASFTQLLSKRYKGKLDADADDFIAFAVDGASRMQRLIQDLLTYSRVGTKTKKLMPTSSEIALKLALLNLHETVEQSSAQVTYDPLPTVLSDESQLTQLFQNLVGNAIKYQNSTPPRIHISAARSENKTWLFSVRDNGLGIDPRYFDKIFGMFQRLHKREEFAGTGIGLAICKKIVERHGGTMSVESQPGNGSTFRFALAESISK
jgi:PAS domain S-box-containing protein